MEIGTGLAVASIAISLLGAFKIAWPSLKNGSKKCPYHDGFEIRLKEGDERMDRLYKSIATTMKVIVAIAGHMKIPINELQQEIQDMISERR